MPKKINKSVQYPDKILLAAGAWLKITLFAYSNLRFYDLRVITVESGF